MTRESVLVVPDHCLLVYVFIWYSVALHGAKFRLFVRRPGTPPSFLISLCPCQKVWSVHLCSRLSFSSNAFPGPHSLWHTRLTPESRTPVRLPYCKQESNCFSGDFALRFLLSLCERKLFQEDRRPTCRLLRLSPSTGTLSEHPVLSQEYFSFGVTGVTTSRSPAPPVIVTLVLNGVWVPDSPSFTPACKGPIQERRCPRWRLNEEGEGVGR